MSYGGMLEMFKFYFCFDKIWLSDFFESIIFVMAIKLYIYIDTCDYSFNMVII